MTLAGPHLPPRPPEAPPPMPADGRSPHSGEPVTVAHRRVSARVIAVAVAVALILAGNAAALVLVGREDEQVAGPPPAPTTTPAPELAPPPSAPAADAPPPVPEPTTSTTVPNTPLGRMVAELSAFVADQRELEFLRPVEVELLDDRAFVDRLLAGSEENRADTDKTEQVLQALQLIEPGVDLFDTYVEFYSAAVLGFYDPESDELVLRGRELTPYVRSTLVHELSHALDDQHFELHRPEVDEADDESALALSALIEGVSVSIENAYTETLSAAEQEQASREAAEFSRRAAGSRIPLIVTQLAQFPYLFGPLFVGALVEEGREPRVDAAFRDPPTTSEEILDPSVYLRGEAPIAVPQPSDRGLRLIDQGTYGQWALYLTLDHFLDSEVADSASDGWGGDRYVAWDEGGRVCVRMAYAMDSPTDLDQLESAWRAWAGAHGDTTVTRGADAVTVTACG